MREADNLRVPNVMKSGSLNLLEPSRPHRACYGTPLPSYRVGIACGRNNNNNNSNKVKLHRRMCPLTPIFLKYAATASAFINTVFKGCFLA